MAFQNFLKANTQHEFKTALSTSVGTLRLFPRNQICENQEFSHRSRKAASRESVIARKRHSIGGAALVFALFVFTPVVCNAQSLTQIVDPKLSSFRFSLVTPFATLNGKLKDFAGTLVLLERDLTKSKVSFSFMTNHSELQSSGEGLNLQPLLQSLPPEKVTFESTRIIPKSGSEYTVKGKFKIGNREGTTSIPVRFERSKTSSVARIKMNGGVDDENGESPIPLVPGQTTGSVDAQLVFRNK